jgi:hypothetical protein
MRRGTAAILVRGSGATMMTQFLRCFVGESGYDASRRMAP